MSKTDPSPGKISGQVNIFVKCFELMQRAGIIEHPLCQEAVRKFYFVYKRYFEDPFHALTRRYPAMFHNGHVLDIGANVGYTACTFAECISPGFSVFAFEPEENSFALLLTSIRKQQLDGVVSATRSAVGDLNGTVNIWRNIHHSGDHRTVTNEFMKLLETSDCAVQSVPIVSIDHFLESNHITEPISFIKIDVQGYELPVCRGMEKTLIDNPRATVAFEYCPNQTQQMGFSENELLGFFQSRGFQLNIIERSGKLVPVSETALSTELPKRGYVDILATRQELS